MNLRHLPIDVFLVIGSLVSGYDVLRLLECGDLYLRSKLCSSKLQLRFEMFRFSRFPYAVYGVHPSEMVASMAPYHDEYSIRTMGREMLPSEPCKTLKTLILDFSQSLVLLKSPLLAVSFPSLLNLSCHGLEEACTLDWLRHLPRGLKTLKLLGAWGGYGKTPLFASHVDLFAALPPFIEELEMDSVVICPTEASSTFEDLIWPPKFRKLFGPKISNVSLVQHLPHTLEALNLTFQTVTHAVHLKVSELPPNLHTLVLLSALAIDDEFFLELDVPLPPTLTHLNARPRIATTTDLHILSAGKLHMLTLDPNVIDTKKVPFDPSSPGIPPLVHHLTCLSGWLQGRFSQLTNIELLPPNLTTLRHFEVPKNSNFRLLPRNLRDVTIYWSNDLTFIDLPNHLNSLKVLPITLEGYNPPLKNFSWKHLPSHLTELTIPLDTFQDPRSFQYLPSSLTILRLKYFESEEVPISDNDDSPPPTPQHDLHTPSSSTHDTSNQGTSFAAHPWFEQAYDFAKFLPSDLQVLSIEVRSMEFGFPWQIWLHDLRHLRSLRILDVFDDFPSTPLEVTMGMLEPTQTIPRPFSYLSNLPQSLQVLRLTILDDSFSDENLCLSDLPSSLAELFLSGQGNAIGSSEHFSRLPISLTRLELRYFQIIPEDIFRIIPPFIRTVVLPPNRSSGPTIQDYDLYYDKPHWKEEKPHLAFAVI